MVSFCVSYIKNSRKLRNSKTKVETICLSENKFCINANIFHIFVQYNVICEKYIYFCRAHYLKNFRNWIFFS